MLKQQPTLDIIHSNQYLAQVHVEMATSHFIRLARDIRAELDNLHDFHSTAEHLELIAPLLAHNQFHFPVAERVEGGVCSPNPTQRESKACNTMPASTLLSGRCYRSVCLHQTVSIR